MAFYVYILASRKNGTLYTGMTDDLGARMWHHRIRLRPDSFTARCGVDRLVWYESHESRENAFTRERRIKKWRRVWKLDLIEKTNPGWRDLFETLS